ncbi:MmpS family transport accessory protein [Streptomyces zhihengii]|uniref:MmpS family transport accessory protein n=1 Tax=Streptomyces zhihengii TaxID=1818004 RepID=UPI003676C2B2
MNRFARSVCGAVAAAGLALGATACSEAVDTVDKAVNDTYEVTYEVTGGNVDSISYHDGGGKALEPSVTTVDKPELPWTKTVTLRGIMPSGVIPAAADLTGAKVTCKITYKGKVLAEESGEGLMTAGGCIGESPVGSEQ